MAEQIEYRYEVIVRDHLGNLLWRAKSLFLATLTVHVRAAMEQFGFPDAPPARLTDEGLPFKASEPGKEWTLWAGRLGHEGFSSRP